MVRLVHDDGGHPLRAEHGGPALDQLVVTMELPERVARPARLVAEHLAEPGLVGLGHPGLDVLLPLRGQDPAQRAQRHHDVEPVPVEVTGDPLDDLGGRPGEELGRHDDSRFPGPARLADEVAPVAHRRRGAGGRGRGLSGHGSDRRGGVAGLAQVADPLGEHRCPGAEEGRLEGCRPGLVRADMDEPRPRREQEPGAFRRPVRHWRTLLLLLDRRSSLPRRAAVLESPPWGSRSGTPRRRSTRRPSTSSAPASWSGPTCARLPSPWRRPGNPGGPGSRSTATVPAGRSGPRRRASPCLAGRSCRRPRCRP